MELFLKTMILVIFVPSGDTHTHRGWYPACPAWKGKASTEALILPHSKRLALGIQIMNGEGVLFQTILLSECRKTKDGCKGTSNYLFLSHVLKVLFGT